MGRGVRAVRGLSKLALGCILGIVPVTTATAQTDLQEAVQATPPESAASQPVEVTADRLEYRKETEAYTADGSVVVIQDSTRLTADHVTIRMLTGQLTAAGAVYLSEGTKEIWADRLELNINTEAGVITNARLFVRDSNTLVAARRLQRFSEDHYRAGDGSFTNCDAMEGNIPAWRFTFEEVDVTLGDSLYLKNAWFCVRDVPVIPIPNLNYPVGVSRKTGLLFPSPGYNSQFGFHYRQGWFWAINPSHDLTVTPNYLSKRGYGGDVEYRYALGRLNKGQWLVNGFRDTDKDRTRSLVTGSHAMQVNPDLMVRAKAFLVSDRSYLQDLGNSGVLRALASTESYVDVRQRVSHGRGYLLGQFLQPLATGGETTFQRLPELGVGMINLAPFNDPLLLGMQGTHVNFFREEGFSLNRTDFLPMLSTRPLVLGHVVGLTPQIRPRVVFYSRGVATEGMEARETFWASLRADSRLRRRIQLGPGRFLLHTIEPDVMYEFVPPTDQSNIIQIDDVDDLRKKSLLTYKVRNRVLHLGSGRGSSDRLDLTVAQSYRVGAVQKEARLFPFPGSPTFGADPRPLQPPTTAVDGKKFSDVWMRAAFEVEDRVDGADVPVSRPVAVDSFLDPYGERFRQVNTGLRYQSKNHWYAEVGHRYTRGGNRVRRGDIWNPISFGDVFEPTPKLSFLTASGAVRTPLGLTVGGRVLHDLTTGDTTEYDVVSLYQNPCRCWSLGLYFIKFPDRSQISFLINLRGIGNTDSFGTQLLQSLLGPLLAGERGLPW